MPSLADLIFSPLRMLTTTVSPCFPLPSLSTSSTLPFHNISNQPQLVTPLFYRRFNPCMRIFPSHSAPASLTGRLKPESSLTKAASMFLPIIHYDAPYLNIAMIMSLPATLAS